MVNKAIEFEVLLFFLCLRFKPDMKKIFFYVLYLSVVIVFHKSKILIKKFISTFEFRCYLLQWCISISV